MPRLVSWAAHVRAACATPDAVTAAAAATGFLVVVLAVVAPDLAAARVTPGTSAADPQVGVVQTLAGPGYCPHTGVAAEGSRQMRSVAIDADGRVFFDTGPPDDRAVIATVDEHGRVATLVSRIPPPAAAPGASARDAAAVGAGRMVADGAGGVLVAAGTSVVHIGGDQSRTIVAGDPAGDPGAAGPESTGDGGPAVDARFRSATALAQDADGNLYVADHGGVALDTATVRFVNRSDTPVTFYPDTDAELTVDPGHIARIAGAGEPAGEQDAGEDDTGEALSATLGGTTTLAVDGERLYIAVTADRSGGGGDGRPTVRLVNLGGEQITAHGVTVEPAGIGVVAGGGDDPTTTLDSVAGVAVDPDGTLLVADPARHRVRAVDDEGFMSVFAGAEGLGSDVGGFNGNRRPAVGARLDRPVDVAVGAQGEVYVADHNNEQVRVVDETGTIRAVPGARVGLTWECQQSGSAGDEEIRPQPGGPASVATDGDGHIYFTLADEHQVKRLAPNGLVTTVAGRIGDGCALGCAGFAGDDGPAVDAELDSPTAVATGPEGDLYIYDGGNARVRYINLGDAPVTVHGVTVDPGHIATVAGTGTPGTPAPHAETDAGQALDADLGEVANPGLVEHGASAAAGLNVLPDRNVGAVAVDSAGNLFIAETRQAPGGGAFQQPLGPSTDFLDAQVRQVDSDGQITTVAGSGAAGTAGECCKNPAGLAVDAADNLYIADASTYQVWLLNRSSDAINAHGQTVAARDAAVVAGSGTRGFDGDGGPATQAELLSPAGLTVDDHDRLHIAEFDPRGSYIRTVDAEGTIDVLVGNGRSGFNGDGLDRRQTSLNLPTDLAVDACGNLLVADAGNDRIRRVTLAGDCDPTGHQAASPTDNGGLGPTNLALITLAAAVGLGGFTAGWYWRRRKS